MALKAALAAEFRLEPVGKLQGSVQLRSLLQKQLGVTQGCASRHCGTLILVGGSHTITTWASALTPAPSLPCRFPCTPEVAVFRQLRRDGSFRQEPLQLLILSVLFPRLSHRAAKKTCSFWL